MSFRYIACDNGMVYALNDLIGSSLIKLTQRHNREAAHANVFGKHFFGRGSAFFFELDILGKGQSKHRNRDISSCQIGGYLT